ncbi:histidine phosphatase family protein [Deinococcus wulumuqiensis]|uniref:Histidine phosphatase family protein n=1 Tax=Deinococcus wulumuqiensis TaxID=980427 RepID=A0A345IDZ9_9DEIO|nr:histidine phosphatase family protein [Deinococcus wulumuqiensis]AXG97921.1 histidine phosphatase family protein [Deinococcus wulumuqiensis]
MPRTLHLIKHGQPTLVPGVPAHEWLLAPGALDGLPGLVARLDPRPGLVACSEEPKAKATAQALAAALGVPCRPMLGLHEHLRYSQEVTSPDEFQARFRRFFAEPGQVVVGEESADDAHRRFANAVGAVLKVNPQPSVAIVAHGTVISLLAARANGLDAFALWDRLKCLDVLTLDADTLRLREPSP